jgi:hypothetical protein
MQIALISTGLAIVLFLCLYFGFRTGLRLGMQVSKGVTPPKLDPIGAIKAKAEEKKQSTTTNRLLKGYANMMAYNGELPETRGD